jgi:hypothetical protein
VQHIRGVVSLLEVQQFFADIIVKFLSELNAVEAKIGQEEREHVVRADVAAWIYAKVGVLQGIALMYSLNAADQQCQRMMSAFQAGGMPPTCGGIRDDLRDLRRRFEDDFRTAFFLQLTPEEAEHYSLPMKGWEMIRAKFPECMPDVEEMRKCFAVSRYPASVFHSMQVIEHGLIHLGKWLGVKDHKPGWNATTRELTRICRLDAKNRDPWETKHYGFISQMDAVAYSLMTAWRHKIDHAAGRLALLPGDFAPEIAEEIASATRGFMRRLADELPINDPRP